MQSMQSVIDCESTQVVKIVVNSFLLIVILFARSCRLLKKILVFVNFSF
ncbi:hypothetical protein OUI_1615 [Helicobacter pylori R036d]|uniref:Uncharacterized protein n=1 Tax=Helicobacter pylori R036d TaxID=1145113 RepID=K2JKW5_HELPX|nr:hypothetical protein OUI_1615 [Helicobacter pylori R036d]